MIANVNLERNALQVDRDMESAQHHVLKILNAGNQVPNVSLLVKAMDFAKVDVIITLRNVQVVRHALQVVRDMEFANPNALVIHNAAETKHVHQQDKDMDFVNQDVILILNAKRKNLCSYRSRVRNLYLINNLH